jgi:hypothetical protein
MNSLRSCKTSPLTAYSSIDSCSRRCVCVCARARVRACFRARGSGFMLACDSCGVRRCAKRVCPTSRPRHRMEWMRARKSKPSKMTCSHTSSCWPTTRLVRASHQMIENKLGGTRKGRSCLFLAACTRKGRSCLFLAACMLTLTFAHLCACACGYGDAGAGACAGAGVGTWLGLYIR